MTDRFYPVGKPSSQDAWKSSYEAQNELRSYHRSAFPPGYAGHEPGKREKFGYGSPGPEAWRLARPELALVEGTDIEEPRRLLAAPRTQVSDDRETFGAYELRDVEESKLGRTTLNLGRSKPMPRGRSSPAIGQRTVRSRLGEPTKPISSIEDEHFSYFVPKQLQREPRQKLMSMSMPKLPREQKVTLPWSGEGTGFRTSVVAMSGSMDSWWPRHQRTGLGETTSGGFFSSPQFHRHSAFGDQS